MQDSGKLPTSRISFIKDKYEIISMRTLKADKLDDTPNYRQGNTIYSKCEGEGNKMKFAPFPSWFIKLYKRKSFMKASSCLVQIFLMQKSFAREVFMLFESLLDVKEVALMLKLSTATIRKWVLVKYIPYKKIGRVVRFSAADIQDWAQSKNIETMQPQAQVNEGGGE